MLVFFTNIFNVLSCSLVKNTNEGVRICNPVRNVGSLLFEGGFLIFACVGVFHQHILISPMLVFFTNIFKYYYARW
ncbi:hypothetical protein BH09BAC3_BH09BAC3_33520 [soil metagenome]